MNGYLEIYFFVYLTCIKIYAPNATPQNIILFFVEKKYTNNFRYFKSQFLRDAPLTTHQKITLNGSVAYHNEFE